MNEENPAMGPEAVETLRKVLTEAYERGVAHGEARERARWEAKRQGSDENNQKTINLPAETVRSWPAPRSAPREIPEAGPGLWSMIGVTAHNERADVYTVIVVPRLSP